MRFSLPINYHQPPSIVTLHWPINGQIGDFPAPAPPSPPPWPHDPVIPQPRGGLHKWVKPRPPPSVNGFPAPRRTPLFIFFLFFYFIFYQRNSFFFPSSALRLCLLVQNSLSESLLFVSISNQHHTADPSRLGEATVFRLEKPSCFDWRSHRISIGETKRFDRRSGELSFVSIEESAPLLFFVWTNFE
jgi:hypothetical protein